MSCSSCGNCDPCSVPGISCDCPPFTPVPGPQGPVGPQGPAGAAGEDGQNAFTLLTSSFVQPAVNGTVGISVVNSQWLAAGAYIFIPIGGFYKVTALPTSTSATIQNLGGSQNAAPTTVIANASPVVASGKEGPALLSPLPIADGGTGASNKTNAFNNLSPLTTTGDLIYYAGGNIRLPIGAPGKILASVGGIPAWATNSPAAVNITGQVAIANGGTGASTAAGARTNLQAAGLPDANTFTGPNVFDLTGGQEFSVQDTGGDNLLSVDNTAGVVLGDTTGAASLDAEAKLLIQPWTQTAKKTAVASASTYNTWTNVETVKSTYSLTGTQTITLPVGTNDRVIRIVDAVGGAATNTITVARAGGDTIMGSTSATITLNYGTLSLIFHAATTNWIPLP